MDQDLKKNTVAVLMPVFNAEKHLKESVESILNQTYKDFKFYIINDGSLDGSEEIILGFDDERIRYSKNDSNKGLIYTLNKGLELINAEFILRMDADDIALPHRIEKQVAYMNENPSLWMCGAQVEYFGETNKISDLPIAHDAIKARLLFGNCIAHPTVIFRSEKLKELGTRYSKDCIHLEDYELWMRVTRSGKLSNMKEVILRYRMEGQNITHANKHNKKLRMKLLYERLLEELEVTVTEEHLELHYELGGNSEEIRSVKELIKYTELLRKQNEKLKVYDTKTLADALDFFWDQLYYKVVSNGFNETLQYWRYNGRIPFRQLRFLLGFYRKKVN